MITTNERHKPTVPFEGIAGSGHEPPASFVSKSATFVGEKAEQATETIGASMESLGGAIREHEPKEGVLHNAGEAVADKLEAGGRYLEEHGLKGIGEDITNVIRRHPIPTLLIGIGVGVLLARLMRR